VVRLLRPRQWIKNGVVAAALLFADRLSHPASVIATAWAVLVFCAVSSGGYILNDLVDAPNDRMHPLKKYRPIAAGQIRPGVALGLAISLLGLAIGASFAVRPAFMVVTATYVLLTVAYSVALKRVPVFDVVAVTGGFVIRAIAGAIAINVPVSIWLLLLTSLIAMFVILAKRLTDPAPTVLLGLRESYPAVWLRGAMVVVGIACLVSYLLYAVLASNLPSDHVMLLTVPFVAIGILRYAHLSGVIGTRRGPWITAAPDETLVRDQPLLLAVAGWAAMCVVALYWIR